MKGQAAILILIIAIGIAIYFILSTITFPPAEGPQIPPPTYSNDVITIENLEISELTPYNATPVILSFYIRNNGDEDIGKVEVNFFSPRFGEGKTNLKLEKLECEDGKSITRKEDNLITGGKCEFSNLSPGDMRLVSLTFKTPAKAFKAPTPFTIRYSVTYDHSGYRIANIPIIDGITVKRPTIEFSQSEPTWGPVQLEFIPPVGGEEKVDEEIIERYWGVRDRVFKVEIVLTHVGILEKVYPIPIHSVKLELSQIEKAREGYCDFKNLEIKDKLLDPTKELKLICQFISKGEDPQFMGQIKANFTYIYKFEGEQTIVVTPPTR